MKKLFNWWYVPFVILGSVVAFYLILIGYRLVEGNRVNGQENQQTGSGSGFWSNLGQSMGIGTRKLKGEKSGRINILVAGVGGEGHDGPDLTDSLMMVSVNTSEKKIDMFSIPRDLYLEIPGFSKNKINAAYSLGKNYDSAGGGMDLLKDTVNEVLGLQADYYFKIDFDGFVKAVDALGGVDVVVDKDIYDYLYPDGNLGYEVFSLTAGKHHLDGETALKFARSRETTSDFDRSKRQQKLLIAMKDALLNKGAVDGSITLIKLIDIVSKNIETDLKVWEWERIATIAKNWGDEAKISMHGLNNSDDGFLMDGNVDGMYVLIPQAGDFSDIQDFVETTLSEKGGEVMQVIVLDIYNATNRVGLAGSMSEVLKKEGYSTDKIGNSEQIYEESVAQCRDGKDLNSFKNELKKKWNFKIEELKNESTTSDCVLYLGSNLELS